MMSFTMREILASVAFGCLFGFLFFMIFTAVNLLIYRSRVFFTFPLLLIQYDKILENPIKNIGRNKIKANSTIFFLFVILFFLGFVLLSYYVLDGCIRIYLFLLSVCTFFISKALLYELLNSFLDRVIGAAFYLLVLCFRIFIFPFLRLSLVLYSKILESKIKF